MAAYARQPFADLGAPRLHALHSAKNRQNAMSSPTFSSPLKPTSTPATGKRQRAPDMFHDDVDAENVDPADWATSPSKKPKTVGAFQKPSKFALATPPPAKSPAATPVPSSRKTLSSPSTARSTPISHTRGSPKHNRVGALAKRRASTSPFRRIDPPSFSSSPTLPFSIDAALSGTIKNYTPKAPTPAPAPAPAPVSAPSPAPAQHVSTLEDSMPKSWFFAIHEDTPEQEAANLMEHSASVLDISTDDDVQDKKLNQERGKENIPPMDFVATQSPTAEEPTPRLRLRKVAQDAMDEDRRPLGDLVPEDFYGQGCDKDTYVTVDAGIEKPSSLSKECAFPEEEEEEEEEKEEEPSEQDVVDPASVANQPKPTPSKKAVPVEDALAPVSPPSQSQSQDVTSSTPLQESCSEEL